MVYKPKTMLDSGAYSAWYHKMTIDLDGYMAFIKEHRSRFYSIVALDKIPGEKARMAKNRSEIEEAAAQSYTNFSIMRHAGIDCIPVFHQGEDFKWLERMLDERVPYIGISPYLRAGQDSILRWLVHVFTRITDKEGRPLCKTHGFGVTSHRIVRRYPWFSLDSTTWALSAAYGNILMPRFKRTGPDYAYPQQFRMSERDSGASNNSLLDIPPWDRRMVDEYFETLGLTFGEVRRVHNARLRVNASYYLGLEAQLTAAPFNPSRRLAGIKPRLYGQRAADFDYAPKIFLATMIKTHQQANVLTQLGAKHRLISYYDCGRCDAEQIDGYTSKGMCPISLTGWRAWVAGLKTPQPLKRSRQN